MKVKDLMRILKMADPDACVRISAPDEDVGYAEETAHGVELRWQEDGGQVAIIRSEG